MESFWQTSRNPGQNKFYGKNGVLPGRILRDQISGIFLSRRDIWHVCFILFIALKLKKLNPYESYAISLSEKKPMKIINFVLDLTWSKELGRK